MFPGRDRVFYWLLAGCIRNCMFRESYMYQRFCLIFGPFYNYVFLVIILWNRQDSSSGFACIVFHKKGRKNVSLLSPYAQCF